MTTFPKLKARSRKNSLPYAISFFLFFASLLAVNYAFSRYFNSPPEEHTLLQPSVRSSADYGELCSSGILSNALSLLFIIPVIIFCFIGLAIVTDDYFVSALEQICAQLKLSEDVAGATFMAAGSSTPEFFSSMIGTFITKDEVGVGTIVGSAVFNILVIIGLSSALAGSILHLDWRPLLRDSTFYIISIVQLFLFTFVISKGIIKWWEGLILVLTYCVYILFMAFGNKPYMRFAAKLCWFGIHPEEPDQNDLESGNVTSNANIPPKDLPTDLPLDAIPSMDMPSEQQQSPQPSPTRYFSSPFNSNSSDQQPPPRRATSQLPRATILQDDKIRYRDLHLRTRLKAAQISIIAIERMKNDARQPDRQRSSTEESNEIRNALKKVTTDTIPDMDNNNNTSSSSQHQASSSAADGQDNENQKQVFGVDLPSSYVGWSLFPFTFIWKILYRYTIVDCSKKGNEKLWWVTFLTSIAWISGVSYGMVQLARICGCLLNIPATAMGLTVLAAGTSIPDALASISVARDGAGDMAVSNAIGSNVFDILLGLGVPWFLGDLALRSNAVSNPITIDVEPVTLVVVPIIILFTIMITFVGILIALKWTMKPLLGYLLCGLYLVFVTYTILDVYVFKIGN